MDPNSGTSVMLELARGLAVLMEAGWRPERTIQFGSWDGEEFEYGVVVMTLGRAGRQAPHTLLSRWAGRGRLTV